MLVVFAMGLNKVKGKFIMLSAQTRKKYRIIPWISWSLAATFYFYEFSLQVSPDVMADLLMRDFNIDATHLGYLGGTYFFSYAILQIPVGLLLDYIGPRHMLSFATLMCMSGSFLFGLSHSYYEAMLARFCIGLGSAFAAVGCMKIAANWFPVNRFAALVGLSVTAGMLGAVVGHKPLAIVVSEFGWRHSMFLLGAFSGLLSLLIWLFLRDAPEHNTRRPTATSDMSILQGLKHIIFAKQSWFIACYGGLMYAPTLVLGSLWGGSFLMVQYGLSRDVAAGIVSLIFFGWLFGSTSFGMLSDRLGQRKLPMLIGALGSLIFCVFVIYVKMPLMLLRLVFFFLGFFSSGFLPSFSLIKETNPLHLGATSLGFMNTLNMVGPTVFQPLVGYLLDLAWTGELVDGTRFYSVASYTIALSVLPTCLLLSILLIPFIKESYCKQV